MLGPSGCGKSTLLKAVGGYLQPTEGEIRLKGELIEKPGPDRMMVFQEFDQLLPWKTVQRERRVPAQDDGQRCAAKPPRSGAMHYIEKVNLTKFADSYPHTLSGGMKQRVAIARGMAMEPDILLMDEPFAALDALTRRAMQDELLALWDETHFTVLFVTHSIPEAIKIGSRILLLSPHPGQVKAELNSVPRGQRSSDEAAALGREIHDMLFADQIEEAAAMLEAVRRRRTSSTARRSDREQFGIIEKPLTLCRERSTTRPGCARSAILVVLALAWELYGRWLDNPLLLPTFTDTVRALCGRRAQRRPFRSRALSSIEVLLVGYATGTVLAGAADHVRHQPRASAPTSSRP